MSRRSSLNGRLSLSTPNLSSPIAESTHIAGLQQKFPWGGIHTPLKVESSQSHSRNLDLSIKKPNFSTALQKLDPRIYTDVQSQGLTSRIVKYYENSKKLNRSTSINNLYKPGQFPVVHLKKSEIQYRPSRNRNNVSIVRIAPPDKSVFQANSRSSILRTGSIVPTVSLGLKQTNNDISRENRPILHPAVDNEIAPTRSVLEALKEISRKRINSDELDCNDSIKKYCKESSHELLSNLSGSVPPLSSHPNSLSSNGPLYPKNATKRNRELTSPSVSPTAKIPNNGQNSKSVLLRPRKTNNEFTSAISSSLSLLTPKRKHHEQMFSRMNTSISEETSPSNDQPKQKQTCKIKVGSEQNFASVKRLKNVAYSLSETSTELQCTTEKIDYPYKTISEPIIKVDSTSTECNNEKPKLTLFNKKYEILDNYGVKKTTNFGDDENEVPKISFVKPNNNASNIGINLAKNAVIEKTQKTKLALMLSGLRGDLNEDQDEVDNNSAIEKTPSIEKNKNEIAQKNLILNIQNGNIETIKEDTTKLKVKDLKSDFSILKDVNRPGSIKKDGGFKTALDQNKPTNSISFDLKNATNNLSNSGSFDFGKNINEKQTSQNSLMLNLKSMSTVAPTTGPSSSNGDLSKIVFKPKDSEESASKSIIPNLSVTTNVSKEFNSNMNQITSLQLPKQITESNHVIESGAKQQTTKNNSVVSGAILFGSVEHVETSNKLTSDSIKDQDSKGGFPFGNDLTNLKNGSKMFQLSRSNDVPFSNTFTITSNISSNTNNQNLQPTPSFSFGNNQPNKCNENSIILTTSQQSGQPTSTFSFTSTTNSSTPVFTFGNINATGNANQQSNETVKLDLNVKSTNAENNNSIMKQSQNSFTTENFKPSGFSNNVEVSNTQNNVFQFGNSSQKAFSFKNADSSNNKPNSVFASTSYNSAASNVNNLFGTTSGSSINVFENNIEKTTAPLQENKAPIFGSISDASLQKSATTFNFNNNNLNPPNTNSNTSTGIFSFGSNIQNAPTENNVSTSNFTFGGNNSNTISNTFSNTKEEEKLNTFTAPNSLPSIFGNNTFGNNIINSSNNNRNMPSNTFGNSVASSFNSDSQNNSINTFNNSLKPNDGKYSFNQFANNANTNLNSYTNNNNNNNNNYSSTINNTNNIPDNNNINNNSNNNNNNDKLTNNINGNAGNVNNNNNANNTLFSFSGLNNSTSNVFSFGGSNAMPTSDTNNKPASFNFPGNTGNGNSIFGTTNNSSNIFNTGAIAASERPIRKATRRLNK